MAIAQGGGRESFGFLKADSEVEKGGEKKEKFGNESALGRG
jgi:hypothetical protein